MLSTVLGKMGAPINARSMMYKVVVKEVLMYGSEIWVMTDIMIMVLEGFHQKIARRLRV